MDLAGCPRVAGDEDEDDTDDLENEFSFRAKEEMQYGAEAMLQGRMRFGRGTDSEMPRGIVSSVPLLTNGEMVLLLPLSSQLVDFLVKCPCKYVRSAHCYTSSYNTDSLGANVYLHLSECVNVVQEIMYFINHTC